MKPNPTPSPQRPKARVMWAHPADLREHKGSPETPLEMVERKSYTSGLISGRLPMHSTPCLILPTATRKQALALKKFWDLSEEEQVEAVAKETYYRYYSRPQTQVKGLVGPYDWSREPAWLKEDYRHQARAILRLIKG